MALKIIFALLVVLGGFLVFVSTKDGKFRYERSDVINAPSEKIFPFLISFKLGTQWNPYEQKDPNMKKNYSGIDGQVGSSMEFDGNKEVGSGKLEVLNMIPNKSVHIKLTMLKPFHGENTVDYNLTPEGGGTRFSWAMSGDGGFLGKLMATFIDCEKMVAGDFEKGISNLKAIVERSTK